MKINRSSKCYFDKWLTNKKKAELKEILKEYSRICNYFVWKYENDILAKSKFELCGAKYTNLCVIETGTFLTIGIISEALYEAYGAVQSAKSNAENRKDKRYFRPKFYGKKMTLSQRVQSHGVSQNTAFFDYNIILKGFRNDKGRGYKISIPLKKHVQFNKWYNLGRIANSVVITDKYVLFSFEIETGAKKTDGNEYGFDFGVKQLGALSDGRVIGGGIGIEGMVHDLQRKKRCSKAYYRKKEEIREYINREVKNIDFPNTKLIVVERLKSMKYKMSEKEKGEDNSAKKKNRSVFYNVSYRQVLTRIQMLSEENRVTFRSINPAYTSQECSQCGHIEEGNRPNRDLFLCKKCGYTANADYNASKVILKRFTTGDCVPRCKQELKIDTNLDKVETS